MFKRSKVSLDDVMLVYCSIVAAGMVVALFFI